MREMRKRKIMRRAFLVFLLLLFLPTCALADIIYLKDGSILKGVITVETTDTVRIEGEDYWKVINWHDIEKIVRELEET